MVNIIICALTNMFRVYLLRRFILIFENYDEKIYQKKEFISFTIFYLTNTLLYLFLHISWVNLLCNVLGIYLLTNLYTNSIKKKLFITFSTYIVSIVCDIIGILLFVNYEEGKDFNQITQIIVVLLVCICVLVVEKLVNQHQNSNNAQGLPLILVPLSSIVMICFVFYGSEEIKQKTIIIICIGLLIINMLVFYLYNLFLKSISEKYENEVLKQKLQVYSRQIDIILQNEERVKILKHDMKHHINEMKLLISQQKVKELEEYLKHMKEFVENPNEIISSGNIEIDGVLNYILKKAKEQLNDVDIKIKLPEKMSHTFDIVVILSNLLENAIEASKKTSEKYMRVEVIYKKGVLKVKIINSYIGGKLSNDGNKKYELVTTKEDKNLHGIGLNSVKRIIEKYNGILEIESYENMFSVELIIYLEVNI